MTTAALATEKRSFTLNRAHKVVQRIVDVVQSEEQSIGRSYSGAVSLDAAGQRVLDKGTAQAQKDLAVLDKVLQLQELAGKARDAIASANLSAGVTSLMAKEKWLQNQLTTLRGQLGRMASGIEISEFHLQKSEDEARHVAAQAAANAAGNNYVVPNARSLNVRFVSEATVEALKQRIASIEAQKVAVADSIADANTTKVELELPTEYLTSLLGQ